MCGRAVKFVCIPLQFMRHSLPFWNLENFFSLENFTVNETFLNLKYFGSLVASISSGTSD